MAGWLQQLFGLGSDQEKAAEAGDTATVRRIVRALEELEPEQARYLAAFAYLLSRVANADLDISKEETEAMERLVREMGQLPDDQAVLAVQIAKAQNRLLGHTENFQVAREFRELSTKEQRQRLLHCLFAVAAADEEISGQEETQVRLIAEELGLSHREFIEVRSDYNQHRSVIRRLDDRQEQSD